MVSSKGTLQPRCGTEPPRNGRMAQTGDQVSGVTMEIEEALAAILRKTNPSVQEAAREMIVLDRAVEGLVKFPRTPHLVWLGDSRPRGDKLMGAAEAQDLLRLPVAAEEKVDGANLGLSLGPDGRIRAQSRGHYLDARTEGQWKPLWRWLAGRQERLNLRAHPVGHRLRRVVLRRALGLLRLPARLVPPVRPL